MAGRTPSQIGAERRGEANHERHIWDELEEAGFPTLTTVERARDAGNREHYDHGLGTAQRAVAIATGRRPEVAAEKAGGEEGTRKR